MRILLAEDSLVNQKLAVALLEGEGHVVSVASNGREALAKIESGRFDLILMDVQMPEMDGFEATASIRAKEKHKGTHIPIIAMTAHALKGDRERCLETGMDAYVAKPIRADELFDTIEALFVGQGTGGGERGATQRVAGGEPAGGGQRSEVKRQRPEVGGQRSEVGLSISDLRPLTSDLRPPVVDWSAALRAVRGNRRLLRVIVDAAAKEIPRVLTAICEAVAGGSPAKLQLAAHTLKGVIRYFASSQGFQQVQRLEKMGQDKNLEGAEESLASLEAEVRLLTPALLEYLQKKDVS